MTNKELSNLRYLNKEIEIQRNRISELETAAQSCTSRITGMPHGKGISDKVGKYATEIADLRNALDVYLKKCLYELKRLTKYIQDVDDPLVRQIMTYRYIYGYSWQKIAFSIGGPNRPGNLQVLLHRYLKKH